MAFDPSLKRAYSSNGEGTLSVISTAGDNPFEVVQTLATAKGARTMALDAKTGRIYMPASEYEVLAEGDKGKRPTMKAGTFKIVVVGA